MLQTDWQGQTEKQMTGADMTVYDAIRIYNTTVKAVLLYT